MANMTYCMFENTLTDMRQVINGMREAEYKKDLDLNGYEDVAFHSLKKICEAYLKEYGRLVECQEE
jgi:hypothetical protein